MSKREKRIAANEQVVPRQVYSTTDAAGRVRPPPQKSVGKSESVELNETLDHIVLNADTERACQVLDRLSKLPPELHLHCDDGGQWSGVLRHPDLTHDIVFIESEALLFAAVASQTGHVLSAKELGRTARPAAPCSPSTACEYLRNVKEKLADTRFAQLLDSRKGNRGGWWTTRQVRVVRD